MKLKVIREASSKNATIGKLFIDDVFFCYTLEDVVRDVKIYGETAIPTGMYEVKLTMSNRFKKVLPLLLNVKNFEGVRIHAGNTKADTHGCILVGMVKNLDTIGMSRVAMTKLMDKLKGQENITIEIG